MKKLLALVLALVMTLGLATVGANAAFADADQIEHTEAVEVLNALGIVNGKENNNYDPAGNVKRSEMAKMVAILMLGDTVDGDSFVGAASDLNDITGHWAEGFIKYCVSQGIVGGRGNGKFDPDDNVTTAEAAKMLLVALGYNADIQGYGGDQWSINVIRDAQGKKLLEYLTGMGANKAITRDEAAQMIWNTIRRGMIVKTAGQERTSDGKITDQYVDTDTYVTNGQINPVTLLDKTFDCEYGYGYLTGYSYDSNKATWTYTFDDGADFGGRAINSTHTADFSGDSKANYTDLYGQRVEVVWNAEKSGTPVLGVYASDSSVLASGVTGDIGTIDASARTVKVGDDTIKLDSTAISLYYQNRGYMAPYMGTTTGGYAGANEDAAVANALAAFNAAHYHLNFYVVDDNTTNVYGLSTLAELKDHTTAFSFKLVDNTDDGKADAVIVTPHEVSKVNRVGSDSFYAQNLQEFKFEDCYFDNFTPAKDDYILYTGPAYSPIVGYVFQKMELQTATVDAVRGGNQATSGGNQYQDYQMNGEWYSVGTESLTVARADINDTLEFIALGNTLFFAKITDIASTSKQIAMIITAAVSEDGSTGNAISGTTAKAKLLLADGSKPTVTVSKFSNADATTVHTKSSDGAAQMLTDMTADLGAIVTYRIDSDGNYELRKLGNGANDNKAGYDSYTSANGSGYANKQIAGATINKDTVIFVWYGGNGADTNASTNNGKVYTGQEFLNQYGTTSTYGNVKSQTLIGKIDGFNYARVAAIANQGDKPAINSGSNYAYLTAATSRKTVNDKYQLTFTAWTGEGTESVKLTAEMDNDPTTFPKGSYITYDTTATDGVVKNVARVYPTIGTVTGWKDGATSGDIQTSSLGQSKVDATDTKVLFIDSKAVKGYNDGTIQIGNSNLPNGNPNISNVRWIGTNDVLQLLVVDIKNVMTGALSNDILANSLNAELTAAAPGATVEIDGNYTLDADVTVPAGKTLQIHGRFDEAGYDVLSGGAGSKLIVDSIYGADGTVAEVKAAAEAIETTAIEITGSQTFTNAVALNGNVASFKVDGVLTLGNALTGGYATVGGRVLNIEVGSLGGADDDAKSATLQYIQPSSTGTVNVIVNNEQSLGDTTINDAVDTLTFNGKLTLSDDLDDGADSNPCAVTVKSIADDATIGHLCTGTVSLKGNYTSTGALVIGLSTAGASNVATNFTVEEGYTLLTVSGYGISISDYCTLTVAGTARTQGTGAITISDTGSAALSVSGKVDTYTFSDYHTDHITNTGEITHRHTYAAAADATLQGTWKFTGKVTTKASPGVVTIDNGAYVYFNGGLEIGGATNTLVPTATCHIYIAGSVTVPTVTTVEWSINGGTSNLSAAGMITEGYYNGTLNQWTNTTSTWGT